VTLLIGVTGSNGVALGTDRKVMRGGETYYSDKIHIIQDVAFATEGYTGIAEDFLLLLEQEIARKKGFDTLYEAKTVAEDVIAELGQRYSRRLDDSLPIGLIMAGLEGIKSGQAKMYYVHAQGYGEIIRFRCSGSGGPYAHTLAKFLQQETESAEENARRVAFVIGWISEDVSADVGGKPHVATLLNDKPAFNWLGDDEINKQAESAKNCKSSLWPRFNNNQR
jgi:20S proteasome alpha/beta subunit